MDSGRGPNLFEYLDYRRYLDDFFRHRKSVNRRFSYRVFARLAGFTSSGYYSELVNGTRNLTQNRMAGFVKALQLDARESAYFGKLVAFSHARSHPAKQELYQALLQAMPVKLQQVKRSQMDYFSKWYYVAVREALSICNVDDDYQELSDKLSPAITSAQARSAIQHLGRLGLVEKDTHGFWRARHANVFTESDPSQALLIRIFQGEMIGRAKEALDEVPPEHRDIFSFTMSLSSDGLQRIKGAADDFRKRVREIVRTDKGEDRIIQLNTQIFPLSKFEGSDALA